MNLSSFFAELKRRHVYKVAVAYVVVSWLLIQAASIVLPAFEAPAWTMMRRLLAMSETRYVSPLMLAQVFAGLNDREGAFAQLERAFRLHEPLLPTIGNDPLFEPIRDDARFRDLLQRLKLDVYFPQKPGK